jgi:molybdate transport system permease protein
MSVTARDEAPRGGVDHADPQAAGRSCAASRADGRGNRSGPDRGRDRAGSRPRRAGPGSRTERPPVALAVPALAGLAFLVLPVVGMLAKTPWRELPSLLASDTAWTALRLSLECATIAMGVSLVLGVPLAWLLARTRIPARGFLRSLVMVPLVLPPVVAGLALLLAFGRHGLLGGFLDREFGVTLPFTTAGVVVAESFVALPYLVVSVASALRLSDPQLEEAAATCGANRWQIFRWVTLPTAAPAVAAGAALAWARALGEFGATITFAGNFPGTTQTMPLAVYLALQDDPQAAIALSLVLLVVSVAVLAALRERWLAVR